MSGVDQLEYLSWLLYLSIFVLVLVRTIRRPTPAHVNATLLFGAVALVVLEAIAARLGLPVPSWVANGVLVAVVLSLGYLLMRLVADFSDVPTWLLRGVEICGVLAFIAVVVLPPPMPPPVITLILTYLCAVITYDAWSFVREARRTRGVTRRRMQAAAIASGAVVLALMCAGLGSSARPDLTALWDELSALLALVSATGYFVAFAPPTWLRRAWQEPDVRRFLARAVKLAGSADTPEIVHQLELATADAFGAPAAFLALWDADRRWLYAHATPLPSVLADAWRTQRAGLARVNFVPSDRDQAGVFGHLSAHAALSAPIASNERRIGILVVMSPRSPVFANSDLELIQLLADQIAVILESKALMDQSAHVRAREEAAQLKEDFVSSAAHDLKTPLTGIVTQAQLMQRRAERDPTAPADRLGLQRLLAQSHRLKKLVLELLDVSRLEQGSLVGELEKVELVEMVERLIRHEADHWKRLELSADGPVVVSVDSPRFEQVITNLIENALKYSPPTAPVSVDVRRQNGEARLSVHDDGIGIPAEDQPLVFERFHRARNVDDRTFVGMGLGLYIARGIVEQHGGRIWVDSAAGLGSTFYVALPLRDEADVSTLPASRAMAE